MGSTSLSAVRTGARSLIRARGHRIITLTTKLKFGDRRGPCLEGFWVLYGLVGEKRCVFVMSFREGHGSVAGRRNAISCGLQERRKARRLV